VSSVGECCLFFGFDFDILFVFQIPKVIRRHSGTLTCLETAKPCGDVLQARSQRGNRRRHSAVKADQEKPTLAARESVK